MVCSGTYHYFLVGDLGVALFQDTFIWTVWICLVILFFLDLGFLRKDAERKSLYEIFKLDESGQLGFPLITFSLLLAIFVTPTHFPDAWEVFPFER